MVESTSEVYIVDNNDDVTINVRMPRSLRDRIGAIADADCRPVSTEIRYIVEQFVRAREAREADSSNQ